MSDKDGNKLRISIHAPAKGATRGVKISSVKYVISIHAPAKGATERGVKISSVKYVISIHAPAKGATAILYNKFHFLCIILYILSAIT